jgi:hypothetical protein
MWRGAGILNVALVMATVCGFSCGGRVVVDGTFQDPGGPCGLDGGAPDGLGETGGELDPDADARSCVSDGNACTASARCCSTVCGLDGRCALPPHGCHEDLRMCSSDSDCCNGHCNLSGYCSVCGAFFQGQGTAFLTCASQAECKNQVIEGSAFCYEGFCCPYAAKGDACTGDYQCSAGACLGGACM